jgi:hypothetical protein
MKTVLIVNALVWAIVILLASYLYKETEGYKYLFGALVIGAGFTNAIIYSALKKEKNSSLGSYKKTQ